MKRFLKKNVLSFATLFFTFLHFSSMACSPCGALQNVTQTIVGNNLELTFTSNAGWECCYNVQIEIICSNQTFTGTPNYISSQICLNGGNGPSTTTTQTMPYPTTVIDLSNFCPGTYQWRAWEIPCYLYTPTQTFTVGTASPLSLALSQTQDTICVNDNSQFSAIASNGCGNGTYAYSWSPAAGLSNANIANPIATPAVTTTYYLTVTEPTTCSAPKVDSLTVVVNPLPTATISGTAALCENDPVGQITFTGANATAPYTINYTMNGAPQTAVVTSGNSTTINGPNSPPGTYTYALIDVTDASSTLCSQTQSGTATITVNSLPIVSAGPDLELCEPNNTSPSEITLSGSGAATYTWTGGAIDGVPFIPPASTTTIYTATGTDVNGCIGTDQVSVASFPLPIALGTGAPLFGNAPLTVDFSNFSLLANNYIWDFGNGVTFPVGGLNDVAYTFNNAGTYTVTLTASNGICYDIWDTTVIVLPPMIVTPPNVFTPNQDGSNDQFFVNVDFGEQFTAIIINRWGNVMAELEGIDDGWDGKVNGKDAEEGVYFVKYKATDFGGRQIEGHTYFTLIR